MSAWYEFSPSDTLFFRGSEPLDPGINYQTELVFPPAPSVISGAMRTAVLSQKNISIQDYKNGHPIENTIGKYGKAAPFFVIGPILKKENIYYVPAPFTWLTEEDSYRKKVKVVFAEQVDENLINKLGVKSKSGITHWAKHHHAIKSIGGNWLSLDALNQKKTRLDTKTELLFKERKDTALFGVEARTGIAIYSSRAVKQSKIYNARHIRLGENISLVWGVDKNCGLKPEGVLTLGGEQRFGRYKALQNPPEIPQSGTQYLALGPVPANDDSKGVLIATGKIIYRGGWDFKTRFHKSIKPYYPPGSVFSDKVTENCIIF